jgi:hypothetical protein
MRLPVLSCTLALALVTSLVVGVGGSAARPGDRAAPLPSILCKHANLREAPGAQQRVVLGVVDVPRVYLPQVARYGHDGWAYWSKAGVAVLAGSHDVRMSVPRAWRTRVAIAWGGYGPYSALGFEDCAPPPTYWSGFVGGFYLRDRSACVPIVISVGGQSRTVRFGIGRRCT